MSPFHSDQGSNTYSKKRKTKLLTNAHKFKTFITVIPQKLNLPMNFFETFHESSLLSTVSKQTIKMIGHHSRLRDMMGQSYPIYACTSGYHVHYLLVHSTFCGSSKHTLLK